jgi:hypothetical protein
MTSIATTERARELDARTARAGFLEQRVEPLGVRAFRQPEPPVPRAEATALRGDSRLHLEPRSLLGGEQREHRVARGGSPARVRAEGPQEAIAELLERSRRGGILGCRALDLLGQLRLACPLEGTPVAGV